jgi:hypothetical protein
MDHRLSTIAGSRAAKELASSGGRFTLGVFALGIIRAMELTTILNHCHHHRGFVYQHARFSADKKSIEIAVRPRKGSMAVCSRCHRPAAGYDQLSERRFEFIPFWGFLVFLLYSMRRVDCRRCEAAPVVVEGNSRGVPHFMGKGFRCRRTRRHFRARASGPGPDRCYRGRRKSSTPRATSI